MGPVRQNPIQRTVSLFICVCIALCTIVAHNIAQNRPDNFPPYPPDNHHISDDVYLREGGRAAYSAYIAPCQDIHKALRHEWHRVTCKLHHACLVSQAFTRWRHAKVRWKASDGAYYQLILFRLSGKVWIDITSVVWQLATHCLILVGFRGQAIQ